MPFDVHPATRKGIPPLIALWGPSGAGKTYSAILLARGLVGPTGKIVVIDTENGRAEFYASLAGGWFHIDFQPSFSPKRYAEAMQAAEDAGADVIVIDSMSHVWEGEGGVLEMADGNNYAGLKKYQAPKMEFKRMQNRLLRSRVPVIFCLRAKELNAQVGKGRDAEIVNKGLVPICEKRFIFEMTVSALVGPDHKPVFEATEDLRCAPMIPMVKVPEEASGAIKRGHYIGVETGEALAEWVAGGEAIDGELVELLRIARDVATMGVAKLQKHWKSLTGAQQHKLAPYKEELKADAAQVDADADAASRPDPDEDDTGGVIDDPLADPFTPEREVA